MTEPVSFQELLAAVVAAPDEDEPRLRFAELWRPYDPAWSKLIEVQIGVARERRGQQSSPDRPPIRGFIRRLWIGLAKQLVKCGFAVAPLLAHGGSAIAATALVASGKFAVGGTRLHEMDSFNHSSSRGNRH